VNGTSKAHKDDDMPWKDDLEVSLTPSALNCARSHENPG
jgi:hypothetical protein